MSIITENNDIEDIKIEGEYDGIIELDQWFDPKAENSVLLILNQRIKLDHSAFEALWNSYTIKICADGAANRLFDYYRDSDGKRYHPDVIAGDMDSIREDVLEYYEAIETTTVIKQNTQYSTDFTKSVNVATLLLLGIDLNAVEINEYDGIHKLYQQADKSQLKDIPLLILNGIDGRFDHTIHSMVQFYALRRQDPYFKMCFLTMSDMIILIPSSKKGYWLKLDKVKPLIGNCGLLPLAGPNIITKTKGLKWDVEDWPTSIESGNVSSSNRFVGENCLIACEESIVMSVELKWDKITQHLIDESE
ncbi:thiamine diphosphokinase [Kluyveromyces lactis]|uniref:Thiamine pyrophosphokinase n=1 Tax=Kluyveromyces lactis (strain ATCC 8585 / CBS 2359 / DSM 70799 / NBRC 1267 / NRRL Y-1140 / WM37) TaxID=284590 RepID=Q6CPP7_KLULA|nr:uncharacterized protein KLLA0_E03257g [Kluyveromyces lactis]CAG99179.1 KLLA0E03257p [Kluyveromyces lactis]|eukprot:XP_454092.1 uncharacterized protein KLLA0_E03257g [Kluyveromyces lactis]